MIVINLCSLSAIINQSYSGYQGIEKKVQKFVSTADLMIREQHYDSRRIRHEVDQVQKKWHDFYLCIGNYRKSLDKSTGFFKIMEEVIDYSSKYKQQSPFSD